MVAYEVLGADPERALILGTGFARWVWNGPMNFGGALFSRKTMVGIKRTAEEIAR